MGQVFSLDDPKVEHGVDCQEEEAEARQSVDSGHVVNVRPACNCVKSKECGPGTIISFDL